MEKRDPRFDSYIATSAEFARPILTHLRELVHADCPEVEETVKWGHPFEGGGGQGDATQGSAEEVAHFEAPELMIPADQSAIGSRTR